MMKKFWKKDNLPALDDIELRKLNSEKVIGSIDNIGKGFKIGRKTMWTVITYFVVILLIIGIAA